MYISAATTENSMKITQDIFFKKLPFYPTIPLMCLSKENKTNFQKIHFSKSKCLSLFMPVYFLSSVSVLKTTN